MSDSHDEEEFIADDEMEEGTIAIKKLREKLATAVKEKQEATDAWQRARADLINFKKQEVLLNADRDERIKSQIMEDFLPGLDSLDMAVQAPSFQNSDAELKKGIIGIQQQFNSSLNGFGIEKMSEDTVVGKPFDHNKHEALQEIPTSNQLLDNTVERVIRGGYSIGDRVIRPAQVSVYSFAE